MGEGYVMLWPAVLWLHVWLSLRHCLAPQKSSVEATSYIWLMCCPKLDSLIVILIVCIYFHFWLLCLFHVWVSIADIVLYCLSFQVPAKESKALRGHCGLDRPLLIISRFSCGSWVFTRDWVLLITWTIFKRRDSTYAGGHNITNGSQSINGYDPVTCAIYQQKPTEICILSKCQMPLCRLPIGYLNWQSAPIGYIIQLSYSVHFS